MAGRKYPPSEYSDQINLTPIWDTEMKRITLRVGEPRNGEVGDWFENRNGLVCLTKETGNDDANFLVCLHELIEAYLCTKRGIDEKKIDEFDRIHQNEEGESGDHPDAPYRKEHRFAENIERLMCAELGIAWSDYEELL